MLVIQSDAKVPTRCEECEYLMPRGMITFTIELDTGKKVVLCEACYRQLAQKLQGPPFRR